MLQVGHLSSKWGSALKGAQTRASSHRTPSSSPATLPSSKTSLCSVKSSTSSAESTKRPSNRTLVRQATALKSKHLLVELTRTTRRFKTDGSPENNKAADGATEPKKDELFATDSPKSRDEIVRDAKSFQKQFDDALKKLSEGKEHEELHKDPQSLFSRYRKADGERDDFDGVTPRQEGIPNADSLRSATDLKLRRNTVLRKTLWYSFSEFAFDARRWGYMIKDRKLLLLYAALTAGLLAYVLLKPEDEYDFFQKREFEEEQRRRKAAEAEQDETEASATSRAWSSVTDFASHFSLIEPFRKIGYLFGGTIVAIRMLDATWRGDPLSEDERLIKAHTPVSIARDLRPDEYHHVSPLLRIMSTGHISEDPWTALIPPSPWAPHLTIVIESELLYSIGYNDRGEKVMRKRPFADYFLSALAENAEIIISSAHHSKASAKHFFKLFDPYGVASHTFTAEDHRWDGNGWIKPLEERYIGRRPERVLVLDGSYDHCGSMCQNVLRIKPWQGNSSDTTFLELTPVAKYMAAGVEEGLDTRAVIKKYEGSKTAKDVIREQLSYTGLHVPHDDPMETRLRQKYAAERVEPLVLSDREFSVSMDRLEHDRVRIVE